MRIVFAGTPEFALPALQVLLDSRHDLATVYTQPDRPAGRGRRPAASPVKQLALRCHIPVRQPESLKAVSEQDRLGQCRADLVIVVAYGLLLPPAVLSLPRLGCVNLHASLLPRWRGAAPIQRAILAGDTETGVSLMQMEAGLDTGPVLAGARCPIAADDTGSSLHDKLAQLGARLLADNLPALERGSLAAMAQDERYATYAPRIDKSEAGIDWTKAAPDIARQVRAFNSWPVAETCFQGRQLRIWEAVALAGETSAAPGTVLVAGRQGIEVACGSGRLRILRLQLPGARPVSAGDFVNAHALEGIAFGNS